MDADLDTLATALYVTTDDLLKAHPERVPARPKVGIVPRITDAELLTVAVMQALLGSTSERRWLRYARTHLLAYSPTCRASPLHQTAAQARRHHGLAGLAGQDAWRG